jgi:hypothetical protein
MRAGNWRFGLKSNFCPVASQKLNLQPGGKVFSGEQKKRGEKAKRD